MHCFPISVVPKLSSLPLAQPSPPTSHLVTFTTFSQSVFALATSLNISTAWRRTNSERYGIEFTGHGFNYPNQGCSRPTSRLSRVFLEGASRNISLICSLHLRRVSHGAAQMGCSAFLSYCIRLEII